MTPPAPGSLGELIAKLKDMEWQVPDSTSQKSVFTAQQIAIIRDSLREWEAALAACLPPQDALTEFKGRVREALSYETQLELRAFKLRQELSGEKVPTTSQRVDCAFDYIGRANTVSICSLDEMEAIVNRALSGEFDGDIRAAAQPVTASAKEEGDGRNDA